MMLGLLALLGGAVYGPHIMDGGLYSDDWKNLSLYTYDAPGLFEAIERSAGLNSYRPVLIPYVPLTVKLFGTNAQLFLAWAVALACMASASFFLLLRTLGMERLHAAGLAVLLLVFPAADSIRLWGTSSHTSLALTCYFLGAVIALRGLQLSGRGAVAAHAAAIGLYLLAIWNHEMAATAVLGTVLLYRLRVPWKPAFRRFAADLTAVVLTLVFITSRASNPYAPGTLKSMLANSFDVAVDGLILLGSATVPWAPVVIAVVLTAIVVTLAALLRFPRDDPFRPPLRRWALLAAAGVLGAAIAWAIFIPAPGRPYATPVSLGIGQRTNAFAAAGVVVFAYATVQMAVILIAKARGLRMVPAATGAVVAMLLIGGGYLYRVEKDAAAWNRSAAIQEQVLGTIQQALPDPRHGITVFAGGHSPFSAPNVPTFALQGDLNGAIKALYDDATISGFPIVTTVPGGLSAVVCGPKTVTASNARIVRGSYLDTEALKTPYGRAFFVNVNTRELARPRNRGECEKAVQATPAGPYVESPSPHWPHAW